MEMVGRNAKVVRWQQVTIAQFGFVSNLLLSFAVAGLGLWISFLREPSVSFERCAFGFSGLLLLLSIAIGLVTSINRLRDFRKTTAILRHGWQNGAGQWSEAETAVKQEEVRKLGKRTWVLFYAQIVTFSLATLFLLYSIVIRYWSRLV
jgi:hypothetical protein